VKKDDQNVGLQLVFLLKQRRDLYYQLKGLMDKQMQLRDSASPELLLKILTGRRKLIEKLRELEEKLGLIKSNWTKISPQVGLEHKHQARLMLEQAEKITEQISMESSVDSPGDLPACEFGLQDELLVE
jgi:hypothetical protein